jgi:hypothetical protein
MRNEQISTVDVLDEECRILEKWFEENGQKYVVVGPKKLSDILSLQNRENTKVQKIDDWGKETKGLWFSKGFPV